jgi:hypothetical protein
VSEHALGWSVGALAGFATVIVAAFATRVRLLPEVIDISIIPTGSGLMSLVFVTFGAVRRLDPDRIARLALGGTVLGGLGAAGALFVVLVADVL